MKIKNGFLNIIVPQDISHIHNHLDNVNEAIGTLGFLCKQTLVKEGFCHNSLEPLRVRYHDIVRDYASISHLIDNRQKRNSWFGGVGTILKHVFGTLDENDSIKYDEAISTVQNNEKGIVSLVKQNILVTTSAMLQYNNTLYKLKQNQDMLNDVIDNLSNHLKNITNIIGDIEIISNYNTALNILETTILSLSFQVEDILNAILFSNQNTLHPAIITPKELFKELADNVKYLKNDAELPVSLELSFINKILSISSVASYFRNNRIVFVLKVPLVQPTEYHMYHSIALPTPFNLTKLNSFVLLVPSSKYIGITKDKSNYCMFDSKTQCQNIDEQFYICDVNNVYNTETNPCCESDLISKAVNEVPKTCTTKFIYGNINTWKPLVNNKWIFIQSEPTKLTIECNITEISDVNIIGTGIFNIPNDCTAYCKGTKLITKNKFINLTIPLRTLELNLVNDSCCNINKFIGITSNVAPIHLQNIDLDEINTKTKSTFKSLLDNSDRVLEEPHIIRYGPHYSVITIIIMIAVFSFISFKLYTFCKSSSSRCTYILPQQLRPEIAKPENTNVVGLPVTSQDSSSHQSVSHVETPCHYPATQNLESESKIPAPITRRHL